MEKSICGVSHVGLRFGSTSLQIVTVRQDVFGVELKKKSGVLGAQITGRQTRGHEWPPFKNFALYSVHSVVYYRACSVISEPVWQLISLISTDSSFFYPFFYFIATKI